MRVHDDQTRFGKHVYVPACTACSNECIVRESLLLNLVEYWFDSTLVLEFADLYCKNIGDSH